MCTIDLTLFLTVVSFRDVSEDPVQPSDTLETEEEEEIAYSDTQTKTVLSR